MTATTTSTTRPPAESDASPDAVGQIVAYVLEQCGVQRCVGVPDSQLGHALDAIEGCLLVTYVAREDVAVAMAVGAALIGKHVAVFMKNAGLGTSLDAIVSVAAASEVPITLVVGWAGAGRDTLPHHVVMGDRTLAILDAIGIDHDVVVGAHPEEPEMLAARLVACRVAGRPYALLVRP